MKIFLQTNNISTEKIQEAYIEISQQIERATLEAVKTAYNNHFDNDNAVIPFRPIVIGGDDVTILCSADYALEFTKDYLEAFEINTKKYFEKAVKKFGLDDFKNGLTVCAGISYCNEKFPFHYAVSLAEVLCGRAKKASDRKASCILFHNIHGAAFVNYEQYVKNELTIDNGTRIISLEYGPYYIRNNGKGPYLGNLQKLYSVMIKESFSFSKLREWLNELYYSDEYANSYLKRLKVITEKDSLKRIDELHESLDSLGGLDLGNLIDKTNNNTPIHDLIQLKSVQGLNHD